ncbi:hypothetical protein C2R22_14400 [Salinigranum rubrum]|uniref:Uncharacterized protein n=1 Tax=Salinigranum rubrum TaxID=755307 RepID=A0A2I8VL95_9EURY|nr:hypothetical protein C2R22_14400 [Salinigranum rubrum]
MSQRAYSERWKTVRCEGCHGDKETVESLERWTAASFTGATTSLRAVRSLASLAHEDLPIRWPAHGGAG